MIPQELYRGDSDPANVRRLQTVYPGSAYGYLMTNLSSGGSGSEIFSSPLVSTVIRHVDGNWKKTHYLSFSEDRERAMVFASGRSQKKLQPADSPPWDSALMTLDTERFSECQELEDGVYRCAYFGGKPSDNSELTGPQRVMRLVTPRAGKVTNIILIDVVSLLTAQAKAENGLLEAIEKARRDSEWLVLPIDQPPDLSRELTSTLDDACIKGFERFRFLP